MSALAGCYEKREDLRVEAESQRRKANKAATDQALSEVQLQLAVDKGKLFESKVMKLNLEVRKCNIDLGNANLELTRLREERITWEAVKDELELVKKEKEELAARPSGSSVGYVDCVKRFLKTKTFAGLLNQKVAPSYEIGFKDLGNFIGAGNSFDPEAHSYRKFMEAEMEKEEDVGEGDVEESEASGPTAPLGYEIPLNELLSDVEEEAEEE